MSSRKKRKLVPYLESLNVVRMINDLEGNKDAKKYRKNTQ